MAADGTGQILGSQTLFQVSDSSPVVLPIDSSAYLSNITIAGNTFQFASLGQQLLTTMLKPVSGPGQANYTLQIYNNTTGAVVSSYNVDSPGGGVGDQLQTIQMVLDVVNVAHTFSLRVLITSGSSANAMQLLGPVFSMIVTTLGGGGGGTVSGTTNYMAKFTAATVVGNSSIKNPATGTIEPVGGDLILNDSASAQGLKVTTTDLKIGNENSYILRTGSGYFYSGDAGVSIGIRSDRGLGTVGGGYLTVIALTNSFTFSTTNLVAGSTSQYGWCSNATAGADAPDTGLKRGGGSGRVSVTDGGSTNFLIIGQDLSSGSVIKVPDATSGGGNVLHITGSNAFAGSGAAGANILLEPGTGDGAGVNGKVICQSIFTLALSSALATIESFDGASVPVSVSNSGRIRYNNTTKTFQVSMDGGAYASIGTGTVTGSGTASLFSKWSSSSVLTNVGAAPTTPDASADGVIGASSSSTKPLVLQTANTPTASALDIQTSTGVSYLEVPPIAGTLTGAQNIVLGNNAGNKLTSANRCVLIGRQAGKNMADGSTAADGYCVFIGADSGLSQLNGYQVAIGASALQGNGTPANNTGVQNCAVGYQAGSANAAGSSNSYFGYQAGKNITSGDTNTVVGASTAATLTTGANNVVIGSSANVNAAGTASAIIIGKSASGAASSVIIGASVTSSVTNDFIIRSADTGFSRVAANVIKPFDGTNDGWLQNAAGSARVTSQFDKAANVTLSDITGLSWTLAAGRSYSFAIHLITTCSAAGGAKLDLNGGTATATAINTAWVGFGVGSMTAADGTALNTVLVNAIGAYLSMMIHGTITVNAGGTFIPRFAQAVASGTSSVLVGSYGWVMDMP